MLKVYIYYLHKINYNKKTLRLKGRSKLRLNLQKLSLKIEQT